MSGCLLMCGEMCIFWSQLYEFICDFLSCMKSPCCGCSTSYLYRKLATHQYVTWILGEFLTFWIFSHSAGCISVWTLWSLPRPGSMMFQLNSHSMPISVFLLMLFDILWFHQYFSLSLQLVWRSLWLLIIILLRLIAPWFLFFDKHLIAPRLLIFFDMYLIAPPCL